MAAWAVVQGLAQLWLTSNLRDYVGDDIDAAIVPITAGFVALGHIIEEQVGD